MPALKKRPAPMQELRPISPRLIPQGEYYNPLPEDHYLNDPYFLRSRQAFDAERYSGRAGYGGTAAEREADIDRQIKDENISSLLSGRGLERLMHMMDYMNGGKVNKYMNGGTLKYRSGGEMYRRYEDGGTDPEKVSAEELARRMAAEKNRMVMLSGVMPAMGDEETGYTTAVESTATPVIGIPIGLGEPAMEEPSAAPGRMEKMPILGPRAIKSSIYRGLVGGPREVETEKSSDEAIYFVPNTSNIRAYTRKDQANPDAGYRTIGGEQDKFAQGFRSNGETMYASPEVFEIMRKEGVSPRDPYAIEFMKELAGKNPELFTKDNKYRGAINSMVMQEVYKDPTERGFLLPADQPVIKASF